MNYLHGLSMNIKSSKNLIIHLLALLSVGFTALPAGAQISSEDEYIIGPGDLLAINFWQKPEFNVEVRVAASGVIEIPLIGTLTADGTTQAQLRDTIEGRISLLDVKITQVSVNVKEFGSKVVYVTGGVVTPGKFYFEVIPNVWQIILESGGPLATAQLDKVAIVHSGGKKKGQIVYVNVAQALESGDTSIFPQIYPGDTIHVATLDPAGQMATSSSPLQQSGVVYIWGAVQSPGIYSVQEDMDLLAAIVLAGGPSATADIKGVRLFFRGRNQAELAIIDLDHYVNRSYPLPLIVHSGDAIYIPEKKNTVVSVLGNMVISLFYVAAGFFISRT